GIAPRLCSNTARPVWPGSYSAPCSIDDQPKFVDAVGLVNILGCFGVCPGIPCRYSPGLKPAEYCAGPGAGHMLFHDHLAETLPILIERIARVARPVSPTARPVMPIC
ncbi:MAG: hypothetical protein WD609_02605, partial [Aquisalimonadaceae bacterium]